MKEVKRKICIATLLLAAVLTVSCVQPEEASISEEITPPETPGVSEFEEDDLMLVGIVETPGTIEDFN